MAEMTFTEAIKLIKSEDFTRAYDIDTRFYNGESISAEDRHWFCDYVRSLQYREDLPFSIRLWLVFLNPEWGL